MIIINSVSKTYKGTQEPALKNVTFRIKKGEFVALLGPNGAGKTTLINIMGGHVRKSSGTVTIGGFDIDTQELLTKIHIGIVPQEINFDPFFTVNEVLVIQSGYFGIRNNQAYIDELLKTLSLYDKRDINTRKLSGGMKRRLLVAKALVHKPEIVVLDEPTAGVDIELRQTLYTFIKKLHREGTTVVLTTHYLEEAEELCDRIIIINKGNIVLDEQKNNLIKTLDAGICVTFLLNKPVSPSSSNVLKPYKPTYDTNELRIKLPRNNLQQLFTSIADAGVEYSSFSMEEEDLEDIFLRSIHNAT
jgi:ABC-2 type transport system ATP-binding protein